MCGRSETSSGSTDREADPALELVKSYAQRNGMSVGDYLDYCRKQELIATGMNEQDAAARVSMEKERADLARQRAEIQAYQDQQNSVLKHAQQQAQARKQDIEAFYQSYPGVDPKSIPPEVWGAVRGGDTLTNAYTRWENKRLQAELAAERQNKANRDKTPGSLGGGHRRRQRRPHLQILGRGRLRKRAQEAEPETVRAHPSARFGEGGKEVLWQSI